MIWGRPNVYPFFEVRSGMVVEKSEGAAKVDYTDRIIGIMRNNLKIRIDDSIPNMKDEPLLGKRLSLTPQELAYLLLEVEKELHITFSEGYIVRHGLKTIGDFSNYIESRVDP